MPKPGTIASWIASLVFDSALTAAPTGVRRGPATGERRLLYELHPRGGGAAAHLDLRIREERDGALEVLGQLLPPLPDAEIEIRAARGRRRTALGPNGEFRVEGSAGRAPSLALVIRAGGRRLVVIDGVPFPGGEGDPA